MSVSTHPARFHLITGEYPPGAGGVGDYTALLAAGLAAARHDVHVWCPGARGKPAGAVTVHELPDRFGRPTRHVLERAFAREPGRVLLQYVPNACGARGANLAFCRWLETLGRGMDLRVMVHEPYFYFGWHPARNALAVVQRAMAASLLRAARVVYLSTETWVRYLRPYAPAETRFVPLPIPATVDVDADRGVIASWRERLAGDGPLVVHFGSYGDHIGREMKATAPAILSAHPTARVACIGRGSAAFVARLGLGSRVVATGDLDASSIAAVLRAGDLAVQPYPDGITTRRTTAMACIANGVATVTTSGTLTEDVWGASGAVALAPGGNPSRIGELAAGLLRDPAARRVLGAAGRRVYQREFSIERTIEQLTSDEIRDRVPA
jgi:glycosyltransferase involved in cell wall biosynthesis